MTNEEQERMHKTRKLFDSISISDASVRKHIQDTQRISRILRGVCQDENEKKLIDYFSALANGKDT